VRNCLGQVNALYHFLEASPKRHALFTENQKAVNEGDTRSKTLKRLCETRWASRLNSVTAIVSNFEVILVTLEAISEEKGKIGAEAHSLLAACSTFEFLFFVTLLHEIFQVTSVLSEYLQSSRLSVAAAMQMAASCQQMLKAKRTAEHFGSLWAQTEQKSQELDLEAPKVPRKRLVPRRIDDGGCNTFHDSIQSLYRSWFYEILDTVTNQMEHRFGENDLSVLRDIESVFLDELTDVELQQKASSIVQMYNSLSTKLTIQLPVFRDMIAKAEPRHINDVLLAVQESRLFSAFQEVNEKHSLSYFHVGLVSILQLGYSFVILSHKISLQLW